MTESGKLDLTGVRNWANVSSLAVLFSEIENTAPSLLFEEISG